MKTKLTFLLFVIFGLTTTVYSQNLIVYPEQIDSSRVGRRAVELYFTPIVTQYADYTTLRDKP